MLSKMRIVLVGTTHPGNIGAAARAMKNMCMEALWLVQPRQFPHADATARASGADDLLTRAVVCETLDDALQGCRLVVGSSARMRSVEWPVLEPRACAERLCAEASLEPVALVFGRESSGLTNEELGRCNYLVHIPTNPAYSSLNLAAAVQVLAYEIYLASRPHPGTREPVPRDVAGAEALQGFLEHLNQAMRELDFANPRQSKKLQQRLRRLFLRARPDRDELNILRGILSAAQGRKTRRR